MKILAAIANDIQPECTQRVQSLTRKRYLIGQNISNRAVYANAFGGSRMCGLAIVAGTLSVDGLLYNCNVVFIGAEVSIYENAASPSGKPSNRQELVNKAMPILG